MIHNETQSQQKSNSGTEKMAQQLGVGPYQRTQAQVPGPKGQLTTIHNFSALALRHCMHMVQTYAGKTPIHIATQPQTNILYSQENRDQKNTK